MKICIELDEEMKERWDDAKDNLEDTIKRYGETEGETQVSLTNSQILKGVLREWDPISYLCVFDREEIELMKK
jgi:hypothetical protein